MPGADERIADAARILAGNQDAAHSTPTTTARIGAIIAKRTRQMARGPAYFSEVMGTPEALALASSASAECAGSRLRTSTSCRPCCRRSSAISLTPQRLRYDPSTRPSGHPLAPSQLVATRPSLPLPSPCQHGGVSSKRCPAVRIVFQRLWFQDRGFRGSWLAGVGFHADTFFFPMARVLAVE